MKRAIQNTCDFIVGRVPGGAAIVILLVVAMGLAVALTIWNLLDWFPRWVDKVGLLYAAVYVAGIWFGRREEARKRMLPIALTFNGITYEATLDKHGTLTITDSRDRDTRYSFGDAMSALTDETGVDGAMRSTMDDAIRALLRKHART